MIVGAGFAFRFGVLAFVDVDFGVGSVWRGSRLSRTDWHHHHPLQDGYVGFRGGAVGFAIRTCASVDLCLLVDRWFGGRAGYFLTGRGLGAIIAKR